MLEVFSLKWYISFVSYRRVTTLSAQLYNAQYADIKVQQNTQDHVPQTT